MLEVGGDEGGMRRGGGHGEDAAYAEVPVLGGGDLLPFWVGIILVMVNMRCQVNDLSLQQASTHNQLS